MLHPHPILLFIRDVYLVVLGGVLLIIPFVVFKFSVADHYLKIIVGSLCMKYGRKSVAGYRPIFLSVRSTNMCVCHHPVLSTTVVIRVSYVFVSWLADSLPVRTQSVQTIETFEVFFLPRTITLVVTFLSWYAAVDYIYNLHRPMPTASITNSFSLS